MDFKEPEHLLWRAVIDRALVDSYIYDPEISTTPKKWFSLDDPDFILVCQYADLEPEKVLAVYNSFKQDVVGQRALFKKFGSKHYNELIHEK